MRGQWPGDGNYFFRKRNRGEGSRRCRIELLTKDYGFEREKAYEMVKGSFLSGIRVTGIHKVARPGPLDKARMEVFRKKMEIMGKGEYEFCLAWVEREGGRNDYQARVDGVFVAREVVHMR